MVSYNRSTKFGVMLEDAILNPDWTPDEDDIFHLLGIPLQQSYPTMKLHRSWIPVYDYGSPEPASYEPGRIALAQQVDYRVCNLIPAYLTQGKCVTTEEEHVIEPATDLDLPSFTQHFELTGGDDDIIVDDLGCKIASTVYEWNLFKDPTLRVSLTILGCMERDKDHATKPAKALTTYPTLPTGSTPRPYCLCPTSTLNEVPVVMNFFQLPIAKNPEAPLFVFNGNTANDNDSQSAIDIENLSATLYGLRFGFFCNKDVVPAAARKGLSYPMVVRFEKVTGEYHQFELADVCIQEAAILSTLGEISTVIALATPTSVVIRGSDGVEDLTLFGEEA